MRHAPARIPLEHQTQTPCTNTRSSSRKLDCERLSKIIIFYFLCDSYYPSDHIAVGERCVPESCAAYASIAQAQAERHAVLLVGCIQRCSNKQFFTCSHLNSTKIKISSTSSEYKIRYTILVRPMCRLLAAYTSSRAIHTRARVCVCVQENSTISTFSRGSAFTEKCVVCAHVLVCARGTFANVLNRVAARIYLFVLTHTHTHTHTRI